MAQSSTEPAVGHVVHLLPSFDSRSTAPETLRFPSRMASTARVLVALLLAIGTALCAEGIYLLWTEETPGWWFSALFTVVLIGLPLAAWAAYAFAIRRAGEERRLQEQWAASRDRARLVHGRITDRDVQVSEDGTISAFVLTVEVTDVPAFDATWHPHRESPKYLLQTQVPGVGSEVRVWLIDAEHPLVVEVVDPSVTPR